MRIQYLALTALLGLGLAVGCGGADQADTDVAAGADEVIERTQPADLEPDLEPKEGEEEEESEE